MKKEIKNCLNLSLNNIEIWCKTSFKQQLKVKVETFVVVVFEKKFPETL